jgi:drug/metabolite transporter (DMT)-like permease
MGLLFCFAGAISFGLLACVSKVAEREKCDASALVISLTGWAMLLMLIRSFTLRTETHLPLKAVLAAVIFGVCGAVAYFAFQRSIEIGKMTVGWLMMNLSAGVPAIVSIWMYGERVTPLKAVAFLLALVAVLLLFWGRAAEQRKEQRGG